MRLPATGNWQLATLSFSAPTRRPSAAAVRLADTLFRALHSSLALNSPPFAPVQPAAKANSSPADRCAKSPCHLARVERRQCLSKPRASSQPSKELLPCLLLLLRPPLLVFPPFKPVGRSRALHLHQPPADPCRRCYRQPGPCRSGTAEQPPLPSSSSSRRANLPAPPAPLTPPTPADNRSTARRPARQRACWWRWNACVRMPASKAHREHFLPLAAKLDNKLQSDYAFSC